MNLNLNLKSSLSGFGALLLALTAGGQAMASPCAADQIVFDGACRSAGYFGAFVTPGESGLAVFGCNAAAQGCDGALLLETCGVGCTRTLTLSHESVSSGGGVVLAPEQNGYVITREGLILGAELGSGDLLLGLETFETEPNPASPLTRIQVQKHLEERIYGRDDATSLAGFLLCVDEGLIDNGMMHPSATAPYPLVFDSGTVFSDAADPSGCNFYAYEVPLSSPYDVGDLRCRSGVGPLVSTTVSDATGCTGDFCDEVTSEIQDQFQDLCQGEIATALLSLNITGPNPARWVVDDKGLWTVPYGFAIPIQQTFVIGALHNGPAGATIAGSAATIAANICAPLSRVVHGLDNAADNCSEAGLDLPYPGMPHLLNPDEAWSDGPVWIGENTAGGACSGIFHVSYSYDQLVNGEWQHCTGSGQETCSGTMTEEDGDCIVDREDCVTDTASEPECAPI